MLKVITDLVGTIKRLGILIISLLNTLPGWALGAAVAAVAIIGGDVLFRNYIDASPITDTARDFIQGLEVSPMPPETYNILVANLENDPDGSQTGHVSQSLETGFAALDPKSPVRVQRAMRELKPAWSRGTAELGAAEREGQSWLERFNADVLIWGVVAEKGGRVLRLRFLSRHGGQTNCAKGYLVGNETLELESSFGADLATVLVAQAAAAANPIYGTASYIGEVLKPQVSRLESLLAAPPATLSDKDVTVLRESYAFALSKLGDQTGETAPLERAVNELHTVGDHWHATDLRHWAATQDRLGNALLRLGERTNRVELFTQAMSAFEDALKERTQRDTPHEWAITKNDWANAVLRVGERERGTKRIEEALGAYHDALGALDPDTSLDWAMVQNNYGSALATLGYRETGSEHLDQAIAAYETAQQSQPREIVPLAWAMTATNMATALAVIAERESNQEYIGRAVAILEDAASELKPELVPLQWGATRHTQGFALVIQGEIEHDSKYIEEAVAAFRDALKTRTRRRAPTQWASTQTSMAEALLMIAKTETGPSRIPEAINTLNQTLNVRSKDNLPLAWAETEMLLAEASHLLATRTRLCEDAARGRAAGQAAMSVLNTEPGQNQRRTTDVLKALDKLATDLQCPQA